MSGVRIPHNTTTNGGHIYWPLFVGAARNYSETALAAGRAGIVSSSANSAGRGQTLKMQPFRFMDCCIIIGAGRPVPGQAGLSRKPLLGPGSSWVGTGRAPSGGPVVLFPAA